MLRTFFAATALFATTAWAQELTPVTLSEINALYTTVNRGRVSVHDPSIVHTTGDNYYLVGTMRGFARSTDHMQNWSGLNGDAIFGKVNEQGAVVKCNFAEAFATNQTKTVRALVNNVVTEVPFGNFDAAEWAHADQADWNLAGNMWAPDLIYNSTMQKWCMYQSINGDYWHSVIVLLTADDIMGPYVYQGPVHYSGFRNTTTPELNWKRTDLEVAIGTQNQLPDRYNRGNNWPQYWTNDIDPCVFFDEDGQLWMVYGSWFGGIFIIKLDKETGLRDYTVTYPIENDNSGRALSDPYFGKRIAGGYWSSGEGAYIKHIGQYYYLFISYGGFAPDGGYEMRTFRSATPDGVYLDATNHELMLANERAEESSRMKTKFIQQISHEVRTPLNVLSGFSQVLATPDIEIDNVELKDISKKIVENSERITKLVDKMLDLSMINSNADIECTDTVSPASVAQKAVAESGIEKAAHLDFELQIADEVKDIHIKTHQKSAVKALTLLLDNAIKFTHPLAFRGRTKKNAKEHVTLTISSTQHEVIFTLEDTGIGIPAEQAKNIFTEFVQLDEYSDGTGIGLSIARSLARHMKGDIILDTSYTEGARFVMSLPLEQ